MYFEHCHKYSSRYDLFKNYDYFIDGLKSKRDIPFYSFIFQKKEHFFSIYNLVININVEKQDDYNIKSFL